MLAGVRALVHGLIALPGGLRALNRVHRQLTLAQKRRFFFLFVQQPWRVRGRFTVDVAGRRVVLPLRGDFRFAWGNALAFHGLDTEIHTLYETLAGSASPPRVFFDIGANYGLHALKWLALGAQVTAFEPNVGCHDYLREACALNGYACRIEPAAVSEAAGWAELSFPGDQTYLATITARAMQRWPADETVTTMRVRRITLDDYVAVHGVTPDLIKIDAEGSELAILRGARGLLARARPLVVFESWVDDLDRSRLWALLDHAGYRLTALTFPPRAAVPLTRARFLHTPASNFLARPA